MILGLVALGAFGAVLVMGGLLQVGRLIAWALRRRSSKAPAGTGEPRADAAADASDSLDAFVCRLGDVVIRRFEGDEAWLAGALLFADERPVAVLFIAPEAHGDRAVLVPGPSPVTTLTWLAPLAPRQLAAFGLSGLSGEPPPTLEHDGTRFERTRRLPVHVRRLGAGAPYVGSQAVVGEYEGQGRADGSNDGRREASGDGHARGVERLVVVAGTETTLAWRGVPLIEGQYDVLPGSPDTREG